jgi:hypothetical protein
VGVAVGDGIAIAALVGSGIGFLIRHLDRQAAARLQAAEHAASEQRQTAEHAATESRLSIEASTRALEALGAEGRTPELVAAALGSLARLGQLDLALELLDSLWSKESELDKEQVPSPTGIWLVEQGLDSKDPNLQLRALQVFAREPTGNIVPRQLDRPEWPSFLAPDAQMWIAANWLAPWADPSREEPVPDYVVQQLYDAVRNRDDKDVKGSAAVILTAVLSAIDNPEAAWQARHGASVNVGMMLESIEGVRGSEDLPYADVRVLRQLESQGVSPQLLAEWTAPQRDALDDN